MVTKRDLAWFDPSTLPPSTLNTIKEKIKKVLEDELDGSAINALKLTHGLQRTALKIEKFALEAGEELRHIYKDVGKE